MEKTSKITSCTLKNEWTNPQNQTVVYYHDLEFENGDKYSIGAKEKNPEKYAVGKELTYTVENGKLKVVAPPFGKSGGGFKSEPFEHKAASYAISYSKDLVVAGKVETKDLLPIADKIYNWLISKKVG